ncbi:VanZ family protein [Silvibacterium acidisoli]|uniref:VanZ family protein n=1 Tax=Acidobacteriaceae bacterium ZG23-2 TaxID=2883246 RepID=UPI00406C4BC5
MSDKSQSVSHRILNWLPAAIAILVIRMESTAVMSGANTSYWLYPYWVKLFGPITPEHWETVHHLIRKCGHLTGYGLTSLCFFHGWRTTLKIKVKGLQALEDACKAMWRNASLLALLCTLIVASADEIHQSFLPGRTATPVDVCIDMTGAIIAQLIVQQIMRRTRLRNRILVPAA